MANDHKNLIVWQKSIALVKSLYETTKKFPREELYGLTSQMRRAAVSVPSNIAEGHAMGTTLHFIKFIHTARGSLAELETQIIISRDLDFLSETESKGLNQEINHLSRMLGKMISSLRQKNRT